VAVRWAIVRSVAAGTVVAPEVREVIVVAQAVPEVIVAAPEVREAIAAVVVVEVTAVITKSHVATEA
jgi:hypothetical protein